MAEPDNSAFSRVLSAFRTRLSPQDIIDFRYTTFNDLKQTITDIQKDQVQRRGIRNLNKIRPFLNGLGQYAQVIEVFVNVKPDILAFVWVRTFHLITSITIDVITGPHQIVPSSMKFFLAYKVYLKGRF